MRLGVTRNPFESNAPAALIAAARHLPVDVRVIDLATVRAEIGSDGGAGAFDRDGPIEVDAVTPFLLYGFPAAAHAYRVITRRAITQNSVDAILTADDKATTAHLLATAKVPQVPTHVVPPDLAEVLAAADRLGYPVVLKRTHGAQGRWVRRAADGAALAAAFDQLTPEGPGAMVIQPEVVECRGRSIRVVVTGGRPLVAAERVATGDEWRSNINQGASQHPTDITDEELGMVTRSIEALGLGHAGVDILRTADGPRILEVNACPDFTSMQPHADRDLAREIILASL